MYAHLTSFIEEKQLASLTASFTTKFLQPSIDKLTLLADFRNPERDINSLQKHNDFMDTIPCHARHYEYQIRTASDLFIQLALNPSRIVPNLRIEFNPNKFDYRGSLWHRLLPMLKNKRLTRIDYAIDYQQDLSEYSWTTEKARSGNIFFGEKGETETIYLGKRTSPDQYRIYDKAKEQGECALAATSPHWRIEQQFTLDTKTEFWMLRPFETLIGWKPDTFTGDFIDDLVLKELHSNQNSWKRLSRHNFNKYRRMIKDHSRVQHFPIKPVTTFQQGFPPLEAFLKELLA